VLELKRTVVTAALGLAAISAAPFCIAGSTGGAITVNISLATGNSAGAAATGTCISQTLSEQNGAMVRVVCDSGQFVSISPVPGGRFAGSHGGAYSYYFGSSFRGINVAGFGEFAHGAGSVASYRVFAVTEIDGRLDLLVSF
jgi:hypothetical protein